MEPQTIPDIIRSSAKNMYNLLLELANHIEQLETENADLKRRIKPESNQ
jgi:hypothetical protein